jgi:hypothetical protein
MSQIPVITHPIWEKLIAGQIKHKFSLFAANMAIDRAVREFSANKADKPKITNELHAFFTKYANLTASDLASLR